MIPIAIRIDAGAETCLRPKCHHYDEDGACDLFPGETFGDRLPQCLAAESSLKRLVEAALDISKTIAQFGEYWGPCQELDEALKPFEEV